MVSEDQRCSANAARSRRTRVGRNWASTVASPRSTVILLLAPRNVTAITVPVSGPDSVTVTASGRTSAIAGPLGVAGSTSGSAQPRTLTDPSLTVAYGSRLVRPTNSATNEVGLPGVDLGGGAELLDVAIAHHPDPVTAIASASSWSWVTNRVVKMPGHRAGCCRRIFVLFELGAYLCVERG